MKNLILYFLILVGIQSFAQSKITFLYDKDLFSADVESLVANNLKAYNLEYVSQIDLNNKCNYLYASIRLRDNQIFLEIKDCYEFSRGSALVGKQNQTGNAQAYAGALSYLTNDILQNPDRYKSSVLKKDTIGKKNEHASRYFFAPSGHNLKKGELYGCSNYFLLYDFQYGITDNFSLGMGSTIALIPFYITPKLSFKINENSRVAIGDMLVLGTWGIKFTANLPYCVYTYGGTNHNITIGLAYLSASGDDLDASINRPVYNISGMTKLSDYMFLVSENYFAVGTSTRHESENIYDPITYELISTTDYESQRSSTLAMGALGFRFISKKRDVQSVQFGLSYFINSYDDKYKDGIKPNYVSKTKDYQQFFIPTLSLCYKFGRKV